MIVNGLILLPREIMASFFLVNRPFITRVVATNLDFENNFP